MANTFMWRDLQGQWVTGLPPIDKAKRQPEPGITGQEFTSEAQRLRAQTQRSPQQEIYFEEVMRSLRVKQERSHYRDQ